MMDFTVSMRVGYRDDDPVSSAGVKAAITEIVRHFLEVSVSDVRVTQRRSTP